MAQANKQSIALSACLALLPGTAWSAQPLITDDTGTQGAGGSQLELAFTWIREKSEGTKTVTRESPLVYTRGFTTTLDLYASVDRERIRSDPPGTVESGWTNVALGGKWRFYENPTSKLSFGLKPEVQLPVSRTREARGLGTARTGYALTVLMTQPTTFGAVHANLGAERVTHADETLDVAERRTRYRLSAAPVWNVAEAWKLGLDVGIVTNPDRSAKAHMGYAEAGVIYSAGKDLDLTLGLIRNVFEHVQDTLQGTVGMTLRLK